VLLGGLGVLAFANLALAAFAGPWRYPDLLPAGLTMEGWMSAGALVNAAATTIAIAGAAAIAGLIVVVAAAEGAPAGARSRHVDWLWFTPLLAPQLPLMLGVAGLLGFAGAAQGAPAVALAHWLIAAPYIYLSFAPSHAALDPRYRAIAASVGRGAWAGFWRVTMPILLPHLCIAVGIGLSVSFALYLPTLIVGGGRVVTVTTEAVALASGSERRAIAVHGLAQAILPAIGFLLASLAPRIVGALAGWARR
jgi:putative thiamine transport system permease protein